MSTLLEPEVVPVDTERGSAKLETYRLFHRAGVTRAVGWLRRNRVQVLCYHGISGRTEADPRDVTGLHARVSRFRKQLDFLQSRYRLISLPDYLRARRESRSLPPYTALLTFDDGYRNFLTVALPELKRRGIPATVYVITNRVDERGSTHLPDHWTPEDDRISLSWNELGGIVEDPLFQVGSHTCSHPNLPQLPAAEMTRELADSYDALRTHLRIPGVSLAYPKGMYCRATVETARRVGYELALTTDAAGNDRYTDLFLLRRVLIGDHEDDPGMAARVSGLAWWLRLANAAVRTHPARLLRGKLEPQPPYFLWPRRDY